MAISPGGLRLDYTLIDENRPSVTAIKNPNLPLQERQGFAYINGAQYKILAPVNPYLTDAETDDKGAPRFANAVVQGLHTNVMIRDPNDPNALNKVTYERQWILKGQNGVVLRVRSPVDAAGMPVLGGITDDEVLYAKRVCRL